MKKITFLVACFAASSFGTKAQIIESNWLPEAGISNSSYQSNNASDFMPGAAGEGQTWDFSGLTSNGMMSSSIIEASAANGASEFSDANLAFTDGSVAEYFSTNASAYQSWGFYSGSGDEANYEIYSDAKDLLRFPIGLGQTYTDDFSAERRASGMSFSIFKNGSINVDVDGSGSLITPQGTFENVLRIKTTETYQMVGLPPTPGSSTSGTIVTYSFISADFPGVYLLEYSTLEDGINAPVTEISYADVSTVGFRTSIENPGVNLYPNPVVDRLTVRMRDGIQSVNIYAANGRRMDSRVISRSLTTYVLDVSNLTTGVYLAKVVGRQGNVVIERFNVN